MGAEFENDVIFCRLGVIFEIFIIYFFTLITATVLLNGHL